MSCILTSLLALLVLMLFACEQSHGWRWQGQLSKPGMHSQSNDLLTKALSFEESSNTCADHYAKTAAGVPEDWGLPTVQIYLEKDGTFGGLAQSQVEEAVDEVNKVITDVEGHNGACTFSVVANDDKFNLAEGYTHDASRATTKAGLKGTLLAIGRFQTAFIQADIDKWKVSQSLDVVKLGFFGQRSIGYGKEKGAPVPSGKALKDESNAQRWLNDANFKDHPGNSHFPGTNKAYVPLIHEIDGDMKDYVKCEGAQYWRLFTMSQLGDVVWFMGDAGFDLHKDMARPKFFSRLTGITVPQSATDKEACKDHCYEGQWTIAQSHWSLEKDPMLWVTSHFDKATPSQYSGMTETQENLSQPDYSKDFAWSKPPKWGESNDAACEDSPKVQKGECAHYKKMGQCETSSTVKNQCRRTCGLCNY